MGIYDREYYRERTRGSGWISGSYPAVRAILAINVGVFVIGLFFGDPEVLTDWFAARSPDIFGKWQVWRLVTATFLHDPHGIWHIAANMFFLWFVGREMEAFYGTREFVWLYLSAAAVSTLCWAVLDYTSKAPGAPMIGASGAVMAVVTLYTIYNPHREMILFIFPVQMWLILTLYIGQDLIGLLGNSNRPVAFAAHLGGAGYAGLFWWLDLRLKHFKDLYPRHRPRLRIVSPDPPKREPSPPRPSAGPTWSPDPASSASARSAPTAVVSEEQLDAKLDEILVKIAQEGRGSLTDEETRILEEASRRARNRRSERI